MSELLSDSEMRHLAISLLTAPTARDKQRRIGASNLSNGCDYCLACNFQGDDRATPITDRAWMGRVLGTAFHAVLEQRINEALDFDGLEGELLQAAQAQMQTLIGLHPDAKSEVHTLFAHIVGYGDVGGTIDLQLPGQIGDWKGSTRKKLCILIDFLAVQQGLEAPYGRKHAAVKLSEAEYADEMLKMEYKVTGYFGQQTLYCHGVNINGGDARKASLIFLSRDGTGWFDNPMAADYENPKRVHDVFVMSFDYNEEYALALIQRGQDIFDHLNAGGVPSDFGSHEHCFPCGIDRKDAQKRPELVAA